MNCFKRPIWSCELLLRSWRCSGHMKVSNTFLQMYSYKCFSRISSFLTILFKKKVLKTHSQKINIYGDILGNFLYRTKCLNLFLLHYKHFSRRFLIDIFDLDLSSSVVIACHLISICSLKSFIVL